MELSGLGPAAAAAPAGAVTAPGPASGGRAPRAPSVRARVPGSGPLHHVVSHQFMKIALGFITGHGT